eukprot:5172426-Pyramimonas_sp.AAC.1
MTVTAPSAACEGQRTARYALKQNSAQRRARRHLLGAHERSDKCTLRSPPGTSEVSTGSP